MTTENEIRRCVLVADIKRFRDAENAAERLGGVTMASSFRDWVTILEAELRILDRRSDPD